MTTPHPVDRLAAWSREALVVPPGHPRAGEAMELPPFAVDFLKAGWTAHESALCVARKNAKSAVAAVALLGHVAGPLARPGFRAAIASVSRDKAAELRAQVAAIAEASGLDSVRIRRSPYPGKIEGPGGTIETLSADRTAGHAGGFDVVIVDETGLLPERARELLAGLRSSVSAKGGRIIHISVRGDSPIYREILDNPATVTRIYEGPEDCALDDETAWHAANPGLAAGIKSMAYMRAEVERIRAVPADEPSFRAYDLNQPVNPAAEMILSPEDLRKCFTLEPPERAGPCFVGFDFGEATSGTAAAAVWPDSGRLETWLAFGDKPALSERQRRDDQPFVEMEKRGELRLFPGRVVKPDEFLAFVAGELAGEEVRAAACDGYKDSEARDFLDKAALPWVVDFRRVGAGKDGGRDVRAFQRLVLLRRLRMLPNLSLVSAIAKSSIERDPNGNPGVRKAGDRSRIDTLSAAVIACGLAEPEFDRPEPPVRIRSMAI